MEIELKLDWDLHFTLFLFNTTTCVYQMAMLNEMTYFPVPRQLNSLLHYQTVNHSSLLTAGDKGSSLLAQQNWALSAFIYMSAIRQYQERVCFLEQSDNHCTSRHPRRAQVETEYVIFLFLASLSCHRGETWHFYFDVILTSSICSRC
jgi:hypothetical protein